MLTDRTLKALKPKDQTYEVADDRKDYPGLRLRISPEGRKTWFYRYVSPLTGKTVKYTLGVYTDKSDPMSLVDAREAWGKSNKLVRKKIDPKVHQNQKAREEKKVVLEQQRQDEQSIYTLRKLVADHAVARSNPEKDTFRRSWAVTKRIIEQKYAEFLDLPAADLSRDDAEDVIIDLRHEGKSVMANRTLAAGRSAYNWAIKSKWGKKAIQMNPFTLIDATEEASRERALSDAELKKVLKNLPKSGIPADIQDILLLTLLTGCRVGEVCGMAWREVHDDTEWHIPAERTKNKHPHLVFLSDEARAVIDRHRGDKHVFSSKATASGYIRPDTVAKALKAGMEKLKVSPFTAHDLRRTLATWMGNGQIDEKVHDRCLNHYTKTTRIVYNRAKYNAPALQAWTEWGNHITALQAPNVVQIKSRA